MPSDSTHYDILDACKTLLQNATFTGISSSNIVVRKRGQSIAETGLSHLPGMMLYPGKPEFSPASFEGGEGNIYPVVIAIVAASDLDPITNQALYQGWLEKAKDTLLKESDGSWRTSLTGVPSVWNIMAGEAQTFDKAAADTLYDYQSEVVRFFTHE